MAGLDPAKQLFLAAVVEPDVIRWTHLRRGDFAAWAGERPEGRIGNTVEAFDEAARQKRLGPSGCAAAAARCVAALARCPASRYARLLADRNAAAQRRLGLPDNIRL